MLFRELTEAAHLVPRQRLEEHRQVLAARVHLFHGQIHQTMSAPSFGPDRGEVADSRHAVDYEHIHGVEDGWRTPGHKAAREFQELRALDVPFSRYLMELGVIA